MKPLALSLSVDKKKNHWFGQSTRCLKILLRLEASQQQYYLPAILDDFLSLTPDLAALAASFAEGSVCANVRGRPAETFRDYSPPQDVEKKLATEEVFLAKGVLHETGTMTVPDIVSPPRHIPFSFQIQSCFENFESPQSILYTGSTRLRSDIEPQLPPMSLRTTLQLLPLEIQQLRFGLEWFRPRFTTTFLGLAPHVERRFFVECSRDEVSVWAEDAFSDESPPFSEEGYISHFSTALSKAGLFPNLEGTINELFEQHSETSFQYHDSSSESLS